MLQGLLEELQTCEDKLKFLKEFNILWGFGYYCDLENSIHHSKINLHNQCQILWEKYDKPNSLSQISKEDIDEFSKCYDNHEQLELDYEHYKTEINKYIGNNREYNSIYTRSRRIYENIVNLKDNIEILKWKIILEKSKLFDELQI